MKIYCKHDKGWVNGKYTCEKCGRQFRLSKKELRERLKPEEQEKE